MEYIDWSNHHEVTKESPPSETLKKALDFVTNKGSALDLGAGGLKDTKHFLKLGFDSVTVVDSEPNVGLAVDELSSDKVAYIGSPYDSYDFPEDKFDIINAQYSIPFNHPDTFSEMFTRLKKSLKKNGIFVGQFFGENDEWNNTDTEMSFHTKSEVEELLAGLEIIELKEENRNSRLTSGTPKRWHLFNVIAKRI